MNKRLKKILIVILVLVLLLVGGFYGYVSVYYRADATTAQVLVNKETVQQKDNYILLTPDSPTDTTLIFIPVPRWSIWLICPCCNKSLRPVASM